MKKIIFNSLSRRAMAAWALVKGDFVKEFADLKHYSINYAVGIINSTLFCYMVLKGFIDSESNSMGSLLSKFFIWYVGRDLISEMAQSLAEERSQGTLEYIYLNSQNLQIFILLKSVTTVVISSFFFAIIALALVGLGAMDVHTDKVWIWDIDAQRVFATLLWCMGYGYFFAGLALVFRKVNAVVSVFGYLLLFSQFIEGFGILRPVFFLIPGSANYDSVTTGPYFAIALCMYFVCFVLFGILQAISIRGGWFWRR